MHQDQPIAIVNPPPPLDPGPPGEGNLMAFILVYLHLLNEREEAQENGIDPFQKPYPMTSFSSLVEPTLLAERDQIPRQTN